MKVILTEKQFKEYLRFLQEQTMHNLIMEDFRASVTQSDLPKDFKEMNRAMYGDVPPEVLKQIGKHYTKNGFKYNNNAKKPELGKHDAEVRPEISGSVFPFGNAKLSNQVLIINLTSALHCPSAKFCPVGKEACYAFNTERSREDYWRRNARNEIMFDTARENPAKWPYIFWFIRRYIETAKKNGFIVKHLRLNEAGDFKTADDIKRFDEFAAELKRDFDIDTHAYTANRNLIDAIKNVKNMNINASLPDITGDRVFRHFYAVENKVLDQLPDTPLKNIATPELGEDKKWGLYYKCPCDIAEGAVCYDCQVCWLANPGIAPDGRKVDHFNVLCKVHGNAQDSFDQSRADRRRGLPIEQQVKNLEKMVKVARKAERKDKRK